MRTLDRMHVSVGQKVEQGQLIGKVGATPPSVRKKEEMHHICILKSMHMVNRSIHYHFSYKKAQL